MATQTGGLVPMTQTADPQLALIERLATNDAVNVDKLQALLNMQEQVRSRVAKEEAAAAMADAQCAMRPVAADATNPQTKSRYASYAALDRALRPIYTEHGFGLSFDTADSPLPEHVRVVCLVTHNGGHSREHHIDMPADGKGAKGGDVMTKTHAVGSAVSYGMRYLLKMIFNVAVGEDDDDGNRAGTVPRRTTQAAPQGFEEWLSDLEAVADEGTARLMETWNDSRKDYRQYLVTNDKRTWDGLKERAAGR